MVDELWTRAANELAAMIAGGETSSREVVDAHLARIDEVNGDLNAVVRVLADGARAGADAADAAVAAGGPLGPFHGVPFTIKENLDCTCSPTTQGVPAFAEAVPTVDSPVVERMKAAGAIPLARTNLPELGLRISTNNPLHGLTRNPWTPDLTAGGSSGGEAASLASGMSPFGLGNDLGGSLRNPAYCCGITSLKTSFGRLPGAGCLPPADTQPLSFQLMGVEGPMARHVADLRLGLEVMAGRHPRDPRSVTVPFDGAPTARRAAILTEVPGGPIHPAVADGVRKAADAMEAAGWELVEATPPEMEQCQEVWARMLSCDMPAMVGAATEIMSEGALGLLNDLIGRFPPDEVPAILVHTEYHRLATAWAGFFDANPVLVAPTWTRPPFAHDADVSEGGIDLMLDVMRCITPVNLLGIPAAAVPVGVADGIPQGVQVMADRYREDLCLDAAADIEAALGTITPIDPVTG